MTLRPTLGELETLFWRSLWTFIASALAIPFSAQVFNWSIPIFEQMASAGLVAVASVLLEFSKQKLNSAPPNGAPTNGTAPNGAPAVAVAPAVTPPAPGGPTVPPAGGANR